MSKEEKIEIYLKYVRAYCEDKLDYEDLDGNQYMKHFSHFWREDQTKEFKDKWWNLK